MYVYPRDTIPSASLQRKRLHPAESSPDTGVKKLSITGQSHLTQHLAHNVPGCVREKGLTHRNVQPAILPPESQALLEQAKTTAKKIPVLRIYIDFCLGFGNQNVAFDILRNWLQIHKPEKVELILSSHPNHPCILKMLAPGYNPDNKENQEINVFGHKCTCIDASNAGQLQKLPVVVNAGDSFCNVELLGHTIIYLNPYRWGDRNKLITDGEERPLKGNFREMHLSAPVECLISGSESIYEVISDAGLPRHTANMINWVNKYRVKKEINVGLIYGINYLQDRLAGETIKKIAMAAEDFAKTDNRPVIFMVLSLCDEQLEAIKVAINKENDSHLYVCSEAEWSEKEMSAPEPGGIYVILANCLPKIIFEHMAAISNLPLFFEGANTLQLAQNFGKPCLSIDPWHHGTLPPSYPGYSSCHRQQIRTMCLLRVDSATLTEASWCLEDDFEAKSLFNTYLKQLNQKWHDKKFTTLFELTVWIFNDLEREVAQGRLFTEVKEIALNISKIIAPELDTQNFSSSLLDEYFMEEQPCIFQEISQLPTGSDRCINYLINLCDKNLFDSFSQFIERETHKALIKNMENSPDESSEENQMARCLQKAACKPENNKLVNMLAQIPDSCFELD